MKSPERIFPGTARWLMRALSCLLLVAMAMSAEAAGKGHIFALHSAGKVFNASVLSPSYIDGVALQVGWRDVERQEGKYDWSKVESVVNAARSKGKQVTIHLMPLRPPEWVYSAGVEPFVFTISNPKNPHHGQEVKEYIPWDPVFLKKWEKLIQEFGRRFSADPSVFAVSVTAPVPEMVLPGGVPRNEAFRRWQDIYKKDVYMQAWKRMVDVYQQAFPEKPKFLAPGVVLLDEHFADEVLAYAHERFGDKLWVFNAGLHAKGSAAGDIGSGHVQELLLQYGKKAHLGFQTIWNSTQDSRNRMRGPLRDALGRGIEMGACYLEVYEVDVLNPGLQEDLRAVAKRFPCDVSRH